MQDTEQAYAAFACQTAPELQEVGNELVAGYQHLLAAPKRFRK